METNTPVEGAEEVKVEETPVEPEVAEEPKTE